MVESPLSRFRRPWDILYNKGKIAVKAARARGPFLAGQAQQSGGVSAQDSGFLRLRKIQPADAVHHLLQASDLMRVVAPGEDVIRSRELDRQPSAFGSKFTVS